MTKEFGIDASELPNELLDAVACEEKPAPAAPKNAEKGSSACLDHDEDASTDEGAATKIVQSAELLAHTFEEQLHLGGRIRNALLVTPCPSARRARWILMLKVTALPRLMLRLLELRYSQSHSQHTPTH